MQIKTGAMMGVGRAGISSPAEEPGKASTSMGCLYWDVKARWGLSDNVMDMHLRQKEHLRLKELDRFQEPRSVWMRQGREKEVNRSPDPEFWFGVWGLVLREAFKPQVSHWLTCALSPFPLTTSPALWQVGLLGVELRSPQKYVVVLAPQDRTCSYLERGSLQV